MPIPPKAIVEADDIRTGIQQRAAGYLRNVDRAVRDLKTTAELKAIQPGHPNVEQNQVGDGSAGHDAHQMLAAR